MHIKTKKILVIYTAVVVFAALFGISVFVSRHANTNAATGWTTIGVIGYCDGNECVCNNASGCDLYMHVCDEWSQYNGGEGNQGSVCYENPSKVKDMSYGEHVSIDAILGSLRCTLVQIDMNIPGSSSIAGNLGAVTLEWTDMSVCTQDDGGGDDNGDACPYDSTQARVHASIDQPWVQNLSLANCPTSVIVGSFHDQTGQFADDTVVQVVGQEVNISLANGGAFATGGFGTTYTVYAKTKIPGTNDFYSEAACNAQATVVCAQPQDEEEPGFSITKVATNDDGPYDIGDVVNFRVTVENTGETKLKVIDYRDVFDGQYLSLLSVTGYSPSHPSGVNMTNAFNRSSSNGIITLSNSDITSQLGDLGVGESLYFNYSFRALNPSNRACNDVFAQPQGLSEKQARDCVGITISTDI